jgi:hypothetical protein
VNGAERLLARINGTLPDLPIGDDAELLTVLSTLEHTNLREFSAMSQSVRAARSNIRYLAALWPDASMKELVERIFMLLNNKHLLPEDVRDILGAVALGSKSLNQTDINLLLQGRRLEDPTRHTHEVPIQVIQTVGRCLMSGMALRATASAVRCSYDTVARVEALLGLAQAYEDRMMDRAVGAVRRGLSVRTFATSEAISRSAAHRMMVAARKVLIEIGEIQ